MPVGKTIPECFHFLEYGYQFNINRKQNTGKVKKVRNVTQNTGSHIEVNCKFVKGIVK